MPKKFKSIDEIYSMHEKGLTDVEIARELGVDKTTVIKYRRALGLKPNKRILTIKCQCCGKEVKTKSKLRKYCEECSKANKLTKVRQYYTVTALRKGLWDLLEHGDIIIAQNMVKEMIEEEGQEFAIKTIGKELYNKIFEDKR